MIQGRRQNFLLKSTGKRHCAPTFAVSSGYLEETSLCACASLVWRRAFCNIPCKSIFYTAHSPNFPRAHEQGLAGFSSVTAPISPAGRDATTKVAPGSIGAGPLDLLTHATA